MTRKLLMIPGLILMSSTFVYGATDMEWEWKTESGSTVRCINISLDGNQVGQVKIQWEAGGEYEEVFVTTGTEISPVCHEYPSNGNHSATLEVLSGKNENNDPVENDLSYVGFLNQEVTNLTKLESNTLDYFVLEDTGSNKLSDEKYDEIIKKINVPNNADIRVEKGGNTNQSSTGKSSSGSGKSSGKSTKSNTNSLTGGDSNNGLKTTETDTNKTNEKVSSEGSTNIKNSQNKKTPVILNQGAYTDEVKNAFKWAYQNDVTTIQTLDNARPEEELLRGQMAKILVNYAINILGKEITSIPSYCSWDDDEEWPNEEMKSYGKKACALGIMGVNVKSFNPMGKVSRAQFGTALSRLLWGDKNNRTGDDYYEGHLSALKGNGYLDNITSPKERTEKRQWVWVILERTTK